MPNLFYRGQFDSYKTKNFSKSFESIRESYIHDSNVYIRKTRVFLSHKHDDLDDLNGVIGMLEKSFNIEVYIDSIDEKMPKITSGETAKRIKETIKECDKFILLATEGAIESKWCNWELGFGDAIKDKNLALFPMTDKQNSSYKGNEYLEIYSYIAYENGYSKFSNGNYINKGYYVITKRKETLYYTPLEKWLS